MELLADSNWLIRLEREFRSEQTGPARRLLVANKVFLSPISHAEFLSLGESPARTAVIKRLRKLPNLDYRDSVLAARIRAVGSKRGKPVSTPDAFMAASALRYKLRLVTADKDFSGIPGLQWSSYRSKSP